MSGGVGEISGPDRQSQSQQWKPLLPGEGIPHSNLDLILIFVFFCIVTVSWLSGVWACKEVVEKISLLPEEHSSPKDAVSISAQLVNYEKPVYRGRLFENKIVSEIRLRSKKNKHDLVKYAGYIVGPHFNNKSDITRRGLWGLAEQRAALNLLYNAADKAEKHAFHHSHSSPGESKRQLQESPSPMKKRKEKTRQDKHIEDQEASYVFFDIERPSRDQDTEILQLAAVSGHLGARRRTFSTTVSIKGRINLEASQHSHQIR